MVENFLFENIALDIKGNCMVVGHFCDHSPELSRKKRVAFHHETTKIPVTEKSFVSYPQGF
jgi:hypothetical protein